MAVATATVQLQYAWLMDPTSPLTAIVAGTTGSVGGGSRTNTSTLDGDFRQYVGRIRMIVRSTTLETYDIALRNLTKAQADQISAWKGRLLLLRDYYGRRIWGSYLETSPLEYVGGNGLGDVEFTFTEITYSDEV